MNASALEQLHTSERKMLAKRSEKVSSFLWKAMLSAGSVLLDLGVRDL